VFCTTIEATKGEQLKVSRWQYKPETKLLAARWVLLSTYLTTSLFRAPRKLATQPWVLELQQRQDAEAGKGVSLPGAPQPATEAANAPCVHCGKPRQGNHYQTGACFTGQHSFTAHEQAVVDAIVELEMTGEVKRHLAVVGQGQYATLADENSSPVMCDGNNENCDCRKEES
jgi:hypothetical protein